MTISQKGLVKEAMNQFTTDDPLPPAVVNRMQEDDALLGRGQADLFTSRNRPKIHTSDCKMVATASADTVTLDSGVTFDVGGVIFSTDDLTSRSFVIPDYTTKYLYAAVADDCGEAIDWEADPIERKRTVNMTLEDALVESTPTKMLVLKAVKGAAGETPVVTLYANEGAAVVGGGGSGSNYIYGAFKAFDMGYIDVGSSPAVSCRTYSGSVDQTARLTMLTDGDLVAALAADKELALYLVAGRGALTSGTTVELDLTARVGDPDGAGATDISVIASWYVSGWVESELAVRDTGIRLTSADISSIGLIVGDLTRNTAAASNTDAELIVSMMYWAIEEAA